MNVFRRITNFIPLMIIKFYRTFISPLMPPACRFHPSCSAYGLACFQNHPVHKALWLTCWRIMRCNPFNPGGYDPPPPPKGAAGVDHCCDDCAGENSEETMDKQTPTT
ncbi:MAG: membrane protein insertion efficiency factor YidD [Acidobacteriota bacterium]|nr:membrane protein insertion efficiency factor YidD [Acidobacteriota bacterium]